MKPIMPKVDNQDLRNRIKELEERVETLEVANSFYKSIFENLPFGIRVFDPNGVVAEKNKTYNNILKTGSSDKARSSPNTAKHEAPEDIKKNYAKAFKGEPFAREFEQPVNVRTGTNSQETEKRIFHEINFPIQVKDHNNYYVVSVLYDKTEEQQAQNALEVSERNFRLIFEHSPLGTYIAETNGRIIDANSSLITMFGFSSLEAAKQINVLKHPQLIKNRYAAAFQQCINKKATQFHEFQYTFESGKTSWFSNYVIPLTNSRNEVERVYTITEDITDRKLAENNLKKSKEQYRLLAELTFEGIVIHQQGIAQSVNSRFLEIFGYQEDEVIGKNLINLIIHPKDHKTIWENIVKEVAKPYEVTGICKDGTHIDIELEARNIKIGGSKTRVGAIRDITERKKTEQALQESEEKFRTLVDTSTDAIRLTDEQGNIIFVNPAHYSLTGYTKDEVIGQPIGDYVFKLLPLERQTDENYKNIKARMQSVMNESTREFSRTSRIITARTKSGDTLYVQEKAFKIKTRQGYRYGAIIRDITRLKQQEQKLQEVLATRDKFFNIIAHDLRNPFNSILGFSEILQKHAGEYEVKHVQKYAGQILKAARRTYELLNDLLQWARLQNGKLEFQPETLALHKVVTNVTELLKANIENKQIDLHTSLDENLQVFADRFMLNTIIRNLLSNAIKYSHPQGTIKIIAAQSMSETTIAISDTGVGIPSEHIDSLFRIDSHYTTPGTREEVGSGLGLILCREFVEQHGGKIWAKSTPGEGSVFTFTIPNSTKK